MGTRLKGLRISERGVWVGEKVSGTFVQEHKLKNRSTTRHPHKLRYELQGYRRTGH